MLAVGVTHSSDILQYILYIVKVIPGIELHTQNIVLLGIAVVDASIE